MVEYVILSVIITTKYAKLALLTTKYFKLMAFCIVLFQSHFREIIENGIRGEVSQISNPVSRNKMLLPLFLEVNLCPLDHLTVFHYPELRQSQ